MRPSTMIVPGFVIENPIHHNRVIVLEAEKETNGTGWLLEHHFPPRVMPDIPEHIHLRWTETFTIVSGTAMYRLSKRTRKAEAGETIVMPAGEPHVHPWNPGDTELVYRQRDDFGGTSFRAAQDILGVFATRAGLIRDGLCDKKGRPKNPLQSAATLKLLVSHEGYDANISISRQKFLAATIGTVANLLGYKGVIPKYLMSRSL